MPKVQDSSEKMPLIWQCRSKLADVEANKEEADDSIDLQVELARVKTGLGKASSLNQLFVAEEFSVLERVISNDSTLGKKSVNTVLFPH